jgi:hypothetical protein
VLGMTNVSATLGLRGSEFGDTPSCGGAGCGGALAVFTPEALTGADGACPDAATDPFAVCSTLYVSNRLPGSVLQNVYMVITSLTANPPEASPGASIRAVNGDPVRGDHGSVPASAWGTPGMSAT